DLLGLYEGRPPRFVKRYADLATTIQEALQRYAADVRAGAFPEEAHTYAMPADELARFDSETAASGRAQRR
ncbi:MAG TPA: 3-methyl-2-oxobutanoate hydroxymethyltransferase, partial [Thermoanaerobaculia bacterium]|nr:3-methyl-2-oxobutanoate hydroxymethyltransferase [Thermoanaerobaculia bacterium]